MQAKSQKEAIMCPNNQSPIESEAAIMFHL